MTVENQEEKLNSDLEKYELLVAREVLLGEKQKGLERVIVAIQRSTRVTFPVFALLHNSLRERYRWYYNWHLRGFANSVHLLFVAVLLIGLCLEITRFFVHY